MVASTVAKTGRVALLAAALLLATTAVSAYASVDAGAADATADARGGGRGSDAFGGSDEALAAYITELLSTPDDLSDMVRVAKPAAAKKGAQKAKGRKAGKRGNPTKPPRAGAALPAPCMPVEAFLEQQYSISWGVARLDVNAKRAFTIFTDARRHAAAWVKAHPKKAGTVCGLVPLMVKASATANAIVLAHRKRGGPLPAGVLSPMSAADKKRMARAVAVPLGKPLPKGLLPAVVPLA